MEDLLTPRYEVIADYPNSPFNFGEILTLIHAKGNNYKSSECEGQIYTDRYPDRYPAIFRKMDWWEDRKPEEMPEYVRYGEYDKNYHIYKVTLYNMQENEAWENDYHLPFRNFSFYPATLSEYLNQNH